MPDEKRIMICSVLNLTKEYSGITDVNCYLLFIDLEQDDSIQKLNDIIKYIKDYCRIKKKFFIYGVISGDEMNEIKINEMEIKNVLKETEIIYSYKELNLSNKEDIHENFLEIFNYCNNHSIYEELENDNNLTSNLNDKSIKEELEKINKSEDYILNQPLLEQKNPYDIILSYNSLISLKVSWEIKFSQKGIKYFDKLIKCQKVGILGNKRVGKSFILSKLFGLPNNNYPFYTDDKISIKLKERNNKINYMIFDSQGYDYPILNDKIINNNGDNDKDNENNNNCFITNTNKEIETEFKINKKLSEEFITRFILNNSDMLICVIGMLKYSEEALLKNIMEECLKYKKDNLYVIHNLQNIKTKKELDNYIKNTLMKNYICDLEEKNEILLPEDSYSEEENENSITNNEIGDNIPVYFLSEYKSKLYVYHLIFVNDDCSDIFHAYNEFTKRKIEQFLNINRKSKINISEKIQKEIYNLIEDYSINKNKINLEITKIDNYKAKIIYKEKEDLKFQIDPINIINKINLNYSFYLSLEDKNEKLVILIERPGNIIDIEIIPKKNNKMYIIQYKGKKVMTEEELKYKENMKNVGRKFDEFNLDIPISLKGYEISNLEKPNHYDKNGIGYIEYNLSKL